MEIKKIGADDIENVLSRMNPTEIDGMAYGAIQLDGTGKILFYSAAEGRITGRDPKDVIGKNFFRDVAPCADTPKFAGVFRAGVAAGKLNTKFEYVFDYKMQPTKVSVHLMKALNGDTYWVIVRRM